MKSNDSAIKMRSKMRKIIDLDQTYDPLYPVFDICLYATGYKVLHESQRQPVEPKSKSR